jgi:hypothetical protein
MTPKLIKLSHESRKLIHDAAKIEFGFAGAGLRTFDFTAKLGWGFWGKR